MSSPLSPQAKQKILTAYTKFHTSIKKIAKDHRATVKQLLQELDGKKAETLKKKIQDHG